MAVIQKAKENPALATLLSVALVIGGAVAVWEGVELADALHVTEAEHAQLSHTIVLAGLTQEIKDMEIVGKCRWLKSEIRALSDSIYVRKRDQADPDYIHDLEDDLSELKQDYNALGCVRKLA